MKVWRLGYHDRDMGRMLQWHPSRAEAVKAAHVVIDEGPDYSMKDMDIDLVNIPTDKTGLLNWLNAHFDTDNG